MRWKTWSYIADAEAALLSEQFDLLTRIGDEKDRIIRRVLIDESSERERRRQMVRAERINLETAIDRREGENKG